VCAYGKVLVCQYSRRTCEGATCAGNVPGQFTSNVHPVTPSGPGPCTQRVWDPVIEYAKAAWVTQSYVPEQLAQLLSGAIDEPTFRNNTSPSSLAAQLTSPTALRIPLLDPMPPSPPAVQPTPPPPTPPLDTVLSQQTAGGEGSTAGDMGWVSALILCLLLPLLLCCVGTILLYRISGGEIGLWAKVHYTHQNARVAFRYCTAEERERAANDLVIYQKAMSDAMGTHSNGVAKYLNMVNDHRNFVRAGGLEAAREEIAYAPPYAENHKPQEEPNPIEEEALGVVPEHAPSKPEPADSEAAPPARVLPAQPGIDAELDKEFAESPEDRARRLEWIKYFVREGDLQRAFDLGWDGKPFQQAAVLNKASVSDDALSMVMEAKSTTEKLPPVGEVPSSRTHPSAAAPAPAADAATPMTPPSFTSVKSGKQPAVADTAPPVIVGGEAGPSTTDDERAPTLHRI